MNALLTFEYSPTILFFFPFPFLFLFSLLILLLFILFLSLYSLFVLSILYSSSLYPFFLCMISLIPSINPLSRPLYKSTPTHQLMMAAPLRPQFFCTRPNGTVTPLIAVDELPMHVSIHSVSRSLAANDTQGMTSLGTVNGRNQTYIVEGIPASPMRAAATAANAATGAGAGGRSSPRDYDLQSSLLRILSDDSIPASQRLALHALIQQALAPSWAVAGNNPSAANNWLVPAGCAVGGHKQVNFLLF